MRFCNGQRCHEHHKQELTAHKVSVPVLDGVILETYINELRQRGTSLSEAVFQGSDLRIRPVLMTALAAAIGLLPAAIASGIGSETQRPLARVVVGGMITASVLILLVLPALYMLVHRRSGRRIAEQGIDTTDTDESNTA